MTITAEQPAAWATVEAAQAGDMQAFGLLYQAYRDVVFRFVYFRVGNRQVAEDLTQDTFLRALRRIDSVEWMGKDLGAWLVTIARNLVADYHKSGHRRSIPVGDILDPEGVWGEHNGGHGWHDIEDLGQRLADEQTRAALRAALPLLTGEQRRCIELRFYGELTLADTAATMGLNVGAVKAVQYRACRALERLLTDMEVAL